MRLACYLFLLFYTGVCCSYCVTLFLRFSFNFTVDFDDSLCLGVVLYYVLLPEAIG